MVVVGADVHKHTHTFVAVDEVGRELGHKTFPARTAGHQDAVRWAKMMAEQRRIARTRGKSDPIDAAAVARAALRQPDLPVASTGAMIW